MATVIDALVITLGLDPIFSTNYKGRTAGHV